MNALRSLRGLALCSVLALPSCATILGTAVSPITGGVDLVMETVDTDEWYLAPPAFIGGAIAGPFVAFYNGLQHDARIFKNFDRYWMDFDEIFRPFEYLFTH